MALAQNLDNSRFHTLLYEIAFVKGDTETMKQLLDPTVEKPDYYMAVNAQARTSAFRGQLGRARLFSKQAVELAEQHNLKEVAASYAVDAALREVFFGICRPAKENAEDASRFSQASYSIGFESNVLPGAALALALCGETAQAEALAEGLFKQSPNATLSNAVYLPVIRAAIALRSGHPDQAIEALQAIGQYEAVAFFWPNYLRGQAYLRKRAGAEAMAEFQKIQDHRGWSLTSYLYPLAHFGMARAAAIMGDTAKSRKAYEDLFAIWKDADAGIPILIEARKEYERLR